MITKTTKCFWLLALLCTGATDLRAQIRTDIGFRLGANFANAMPAVVQTESERTIVPYTRFLGGPAADFWFSDGCALSLQLLYDQKGVDSRIDRIHFSSDTAVAPYATTVTTLRLDYLELPAAIHFRSGSSALKFNFSFGASVGYLLRAHQTISGDTTASGGKFAPFDLSLIAGCGLSYALAEQRLLYIDATYAYGITPTSQSDNYLSSYYARDFRLTAGMMFPLNF